MHESFGHMGGGWIIWLMLLIFAGWLIANSFFRRSAIRPNKQKPIDILNQRLALGEISIDEYNRMKKDIAS